MPAEAYHFTHDLFAALVEAIPVICRSKRDVLTFFRGAGIDDKHLAEYEQRLRDNPDNIKKHPVTRELLTLANEQPGDAWLRVRREIIRRVVQFENFEAAWPEQQNEARGAVARVRELQNQKDAFARMQDEKDRERRERMAEREQAAQALREQADKRAAIAADLGKLFTISDPYKRAVALERVLNDLFKFEGLSIRDAFTLTEDGSGVVEQIDGVIQIDGHLFLVEVKWWSEKLGPGDIAQHMVRVFQRSHSSGIFIVQPGYTDAAVSSVKKSLGQGLFVLTTVEELYRFFAAEQSIEAWLQRKIQAATLDQNPWHVDYPR